jgi:hypothetical protein
MRLADNELTAGEGGAAFVLVTAVCAVCVTVVLPSFLWLRRKNSGSRIKRTTQEDLFLLEN